MNVLMLNYEFPPIGGGAGQAHLAILNQYAGKNDLRVDVLASAPKPGFAVQKLSDNVTIYTVGVHKKNLHYWRKIEVVEWVARATPPYRRLLKENRYDLVHAFFGLPTGWLCYRTTEPAAVYHFASRFRCPRRACPACSSNTNCWDRC